MKKPCDNCPFTPECLKGWLGKERMEEIVESKTFVCHKTTNGEIKDRKQCAGHMMLLGLENHFVLAAKIHRKELNLKGKVFSSKEEAIKHHTR